VPAHPGAVLEEADAYLAGRSRIQDAARALARIFDEARIPYAIAGAIALELDALIELKLASGMTAAHRGQDLVDVMELIRARALPLEHAERLHEWVREKYRELWQLAQVRDDA
jgi:hypothetical protein